MMAHVSDYMKRRNLEVSYETWREKGRLNRLEALINMRWIGGKKCIMLLYDFILILDNQVSGDGFL